MSVVIKMKADTLHEEMARFSMTPLTQPVFLNSVPKCGTHLIRNIVRMFTPAEQQYHATFIQLPLLRQHAAAFSGKPPFLSWGHLLFSDDSAVAVSKARHIVLVRDPYDFVLARARFFLSDAFQGPLNNIKNGAADIESVLNLMIFGAFQKNPTLVEIFTYNAVAWMGTSAKLYRYEDIVNHLKDLDSKAAHSFFTKFLGDCGIDPLPDDWRQRVSVGSDRRHSATSREHLTGVAPLPDELPEAQKRLVDYHAPGLRALLGYH
jgi:hypothetical protein